MRIHFLSQYFPPEMGAPAARVSELARAWAGLGHEVTVLTGLPNHPTGVVPPEYRGRPYFVESRDGCRVVRMWLYATPNKGVYRRSASFASFLGSALAMGPWLTERPDVLVATSPQLLCGAAGLAMSELRRVPFVLDVRDLWPQSAVELGALKSRALVRALEGVERTMYRRARRVVVVSEEFVDHVAAAGVPREHIVFVPNGVDAQGALAAAAEAPPEARARPGVFTASYVGTHGMAHGLDRIVRVAERFRDDASVRFLFVGEGAEKERVRALARQLGLGNCTFLSAVPREAVASVYRASDACLVPLIDRKVFDTVLPSKLFEIMAMERPVLLSGGARARRLVEEAGAGLCTGAENVDGIEAAVRRLQADPGLRAQMGRRGAEYVRAHYDRRVLAARYVGLLEQVAREARP